MPESYEQIAAEELKKWQKKMLRKPSLVNHISKKVQTKINSWIPEKIHKFITTTIKQMVRGVLFGASLALPKEKKGSSLRQMENQVRKRIEFYRNTAAAEGGLTGAGGILLGLADFPLLLTLKIKMLFDIAALYGIDVNDYKERLYILHIFQLAFSSQQHRIVERPVKPEHQPDGHAEGDRSPVQRLPSQPVR